mmetsp:Transcript_4990/g.4196  ORF Transcript_4990/g.4196 Transcript_4990/m.4196 type:complete len:129 (+) Transcript_4990:1647-2033(+)
MTLHCIEAVHTQIDPAHKNFSFELFGLDYMIDQNFKPWLIEINTNPSLDSTAGLLCKLVPEMVENVFRVAVDPLFPPPSEWPLSRRNYIPESCLETNKWELLFDEREFLMKQTQTPNELVNENKDQGS